MDWEVIIAITLGLIGGMTIGIPFGATFAANRSKEFSDKFSESRVQCLLDELQEQDKQVAELTKQRDLYKEKVMQYETN
ncbi:MAG: hypothetical protein CMF23_17980 [Ignavibacteriae bacterium]|nr:hypothetical protein [Ignavibacteriota bacterium]